MNVAHLHLLLNHLPVIGIVIASGVLAYAVWRPSEEIARVGLALLVVLAVASVGIYFTGEPTEDVVERLPGVTEAAIETHEEAAGVATILFAVVGAVSLGGLIAWRRGALRHPPRFLQAVLLLALATTAAMGYTAYRGGQIRHTEIRAGGASAPGAAAAEVGDDTDDR